jgi:hypothetical protein
MPSCWSQSFNKKGCSLGWALRRAAAVSLRACLRVEGGDAAGLSAEGGAAADGA